jgi:predicted nuclease with TOPRIM domain
MKLKSIWGSLFQVQNTFLIQKSMKPVASDACDNDSLEYRRQREKNNESVRKSRAKNRMKLEECANTVKELQMENVRLNRTYETLQSELFTLKGLFQHLFPIKMKACEVPTSTLYNIIMSKDFNNSKPQQPQTYHNQLNLIESMAPQSSSSTKLMNNI